MRIRVIDLETTGVEPTDAVVELATWDVTDGCVVDTGHAQLINPGRSIPPEASAIHRWLWEQRHGPIPDGHALKSLDGNKLNTDPSNWELVPRGLLPRLNGIHGRDYDAAPAEMKPTIMAVAKLAHRLAETRQRRKGDAT